MTTDSQRNARGLRGRSDAWLGPVLVAGGVVTAAQLETLDAEATGGLWAAVVAGAWATDERVAEAVARRFRLPLANVAAADPRTASLVPEALGAGSV